MTAVDRLHVTACTIATDAPESDGTLAWDSTTIVIVEVRAGGECGVGYSYADPAAAMLIDSKLRTVVEGRDVLDVPAAWWAMVDAMRNVGRPGLASHAIAAVDVALWDAKAKLLGVSVADLLGRAHETVPIYGSGGFTSYSDEQLRDQLGGWVEQGIPRVKMKLGRDPERDRDRLKVARAAIGPGTELMVDANGAFGRKEALAWAEIYTDYGVTWFEEPVSSDDLAGLRLLRDRGPGGMAIAAGEYGYDLAYFERMLDAAAVDVLQADVTRCAGITELLRVGALCQAHGVMLSAHTAPSIHAHACAAIGPLEHLEYFHDHVRIEGMLFDGVLEPRDGALQPDRERPGLGIDLNKDRVDEHQVWSSPQERVAS
jgi:L-alanine-DL-glutamate epimerase-like enolase superfamily enzyme